MPEPWAVDAVATALRTQRESVGEPISEAALREQVGIGAGDLADVLALLSSEGRAVNPTPGEWREPFDDELTAEELSGESEGEPQAVLRESGEKVTVGEDGRAVREEPVASEAVPDGKPAKALVVIEMNYVAEDDGEALTSAERALMDAQEAIRNAPGWGADGKVLTVEVFDTPRRVYPPEGGES
jgi:hypothetical protein